MISPLGRPEDSSAGGPALVPESPPRNDPVPGAALREGSGGAAPPRPKAVLVRLDDLEQGIETLEMKWSPSSYRLSRTSRPDDAEPRSSRGIPLDPSGGSGAGDRLSTELFLDTTQEEPGRRDARRTAQLLRRWMDPLPGRLVPPRVLFWWGPLRFAGFIEEVDEEWIRFDPDGTPVRGKLRLSLRS